MGDYLTYLNRIPGQVNVFEQQVNPLISQITQAKKTEGQEQ